jgi:UDP-N-acetylglucosamine 2-epimerase (non-hydrolysing)
MIKVMAIFGTRPEAIKMAPVIRELLRHPETFVTAICVTAQHREMLDQVLKLFELKPNYDLNLMQPGQDLCSVTAGVLFGIQRVLDKEHPNLVLVHGDTTTTLATSLASFYAKVPVGHVEAGLRTWNKFAPFPEEINRKITGSIAEFHFAPTATARSNLIREGVSDKSIWVTGNTVIDALLATIARLKNSPDLKSKLNEQFSYLDSTKKLILVTGHRRENFGEGFENICWALRDVADANPDVEILYPVHLNPNVRVPVKRILADCDGLIKTYAAHESLYNIKPFGRNANIFLIEPQEYLPFVYLMERSFLILTDSGGVQEEAPSLGKPVLVMRDTTERPEAVDAGTVKLVGTDREFIIATLNELLYSSAIYEKMANAKNPYGDGKAAERIISILRQIYS